MSLAASFASTSTAVIALPKWAIRVSEGTASWSYLNDGAGGLFYKIDDGVDELVVGEKILAMFSDGRVRMQTSGVLLGVERSRAWQMAARLKDRSGF